MRATNWKRNGSQRDIKQVGMVVEGLNAFPAAKQLMEHYSVEMPTISTA